MARCSRRDFAIFSLVVLCLLWQLSGAKKQRERQGRSKGRPNIIFILTDDQDSELGSVDVMNNTKEIFKGGTQFVNAFVTSPICCPSRSSILTGMYAHNHNTLTNNVNCSSPNWRKGPERRSFAKYISESGYQTGYFGKYLNEYDGSWIPTGWHRWVGLVRNSRFYNYTLRHNSFFKKHSNNYKKDYFTDVITNHSLAFFRHAKQRRPDRPVLMVISHAAPHGPEDGAPQYQASFENITSPRLPNWNFPSPDKHWIVRVTPPMTEQKIAFSDMLHRKRLQTLLSVDDSIQRVFDMLKETGHDRDTYLFFTSDHGYHLGQYGLVKGKSMPYESDIRVPFYVRGPNIPSHSKMHQIVLNIDIAPTLLDIAGVKAPNSMDGVSIMRLFRRPKGGKDKARPKRKESQPWRDTFLVERGKIRRTWKTAKQVKKPSPKIDKTVFLEQLCAKTSYKLPCKSNQKWHCIRVNEQPRLRKCKKAGQSLVPTQSLLLLLPTIPVKEICTCYRPRMTNQQPYEQEIPHGDEGIIHNNLNRVEHSSRRYKRSRHSGLRRTMSHKQKRLMRELARVIKQQNKRNKAMLLERGTKRSEPLSKSRKHPPTRSPEVALESKLERLNARIAGVKLRLESLRVRKKKLQKLKEEHETARSFKERYEEFPCPCPTPLSSRLRPRRSKRRSQSRFWELRSSSLYSMQSKKKRKRKMLVQQKLRSGSRRTFESRRARKKAGKKSSRRSKCSSPGLNCFHQTNTHWKTPPLWKGGQFCFCPSSSNNTYWCLRTINETHNFLYCEFITQFLEYFDLTMDPYQLYNIVDQISPSVLYDLHNQLEQMKGCKGARSCTYYYGKLRPPTERPSTARPTTTTKIEENPTSIHCGEESGNSTSAPITEKARIPTENCTVIPSEKEGITDPTLKSIENRSRADGLLKSQNASSSVTPQRKRKPKKGMSKKLKGQHNSEHERRQQQKRIKSSPQEYRSGHRLQNQTYGGREKSTVAPTIRPGTSPTQRKQSKRTKQKKTKKGAGHGKRRQQAGRKKTPRPSSSSKEQKNKGGKKRGGNY